MSPILTCCPWGKLNMVRKWTFVGLMFLPWLLSAQQEVLHLHQLTSADYLTSQDWNWFVFKDNRGFVWISSINGLNRYDGKTVKQYLADHDNSFSLADDNIQSYFFEDTKGDVWFSSDLAVNRYNHENDRFSAHPLKGMPPSSKQGVKVLFLDTLTSTLWLRALDTLLYLAPIDTAQHTEFYGTFRFDYKSQVTTDSENKNFLLFNLKKKGLEVNEIPFDYGTHASNRIYFPHYSLSDFYRDPEGTVWGGSKEGLLKQPINGSPSGPYNVFGKNRINNISAITSYGHNKLLVSASGRLFLFDKYDERFVAQIYLKEKNSIKPFTHSIEKMVADRDGAIWISADGQGIFFIHPKKKKFRAFNQNDGSLPTSSRYVRAITEDREGNIWSFHRNGITVFRNNGLPVKAINDMVLQSGQEYFGEPYYIYCDKDDRIWVACDEGLFFIPPERDRVSRFSLKDPFISTRFTFITQLKNGNLLASSQSEGVLEIEAGPNGIQSRKFRKAGKVNSPFTWIFEDSRNRIYICHQASIIYVYDQQDSMNVLVGELEFPHMVNGIIEDYGRGCIWMASSGGLFKVNLNISEFVLQRVSELPFNILNGILLDDNGFLWISTNRGLIRYKPDAEAESEKSWIQFSEADGLQNYEFNFWSARKLKNGHFVFGGVNGINIFDPLEIKAINVNANPTITNILINDLPPEKPLSCGLTNATNITEIQSLTLPYQDNTISFTFAALEYSDPAANEFRYQMDGYDEHPVHNGTENFTRYPNLPHGDYTFRVSATNSDGVWSQETASLAIRILPPWYQTWWAQTLFGLVFIGIVYTIYRVRVDRIRKTETIKRKEAEFKQLEAETRAAVLRLQMDPHFIGNCVNSIGAQIQNNDPDTAYDYVTRLYGMMRLILDHGKEEYIYVSDEIELLEAYLKVQEMREACEFSYDISVADDLDTDDYKIPTMILQPFVENAIEHGMKLKKEPGQLDIRFWLNGQSLNCSVSDNGVGRRAAAEINKKAWEHESKSMDITRKRLSLISPVNSVKASIDIQDKTDEKGHPSGTLVQLTFPLFD